MRRHSLAAGLTLLLGGSAAPTAPATFETSHGPVRLAEAGPGELARGSVWRAGKGGLEWTELAMHGRGEIRRTRVVVARLDPARFTLSLENGVAPGGLQVWTLDRAPAAAALALNAGMFAGDGAWGWVVHAGTEYRPPKRGPLALAVTVDSLGAVQLLDDAALARVRQGEKLGGIREAFQSYPALLRDGSLPRLLETGSPDIDLEHRDARLALGVDTEGRVLVALTRFDALGPTLGSVPFGLTVPELALVMRGLGAVNAVGLDGGISAQLLLRDADGTAHRWEGFRQVPLGLSAVPRP
ncbi:MAG TPA: phosphodiester glycosidase family protein [Gemmatimonadales bacterium]|nr:phosphodiester glycosidase family protein [Gemmatimonadales bacterium]